MDANRPLPPMGEVSLNVLWPPETDAGPYDPRNENNNSVVLELRLNKVSFILTGDCEAQNWPAIIPRLPPTGLKMFKIPHHGAMNGMFDARGNTPWFDHLGVRTRLGMSSHTRPYKHPDDEVLEMLGTRCAPTARSARRRARGWDFQEKG